jgi:hypothetical protein
VKCAQVPRCAFFIEVRAFQFWLLLLLSPGPTSKWKTLHFCHLGFFRCSFITHQSTTTICSRTLGSLVFRPRRPCDIIPLELGAFGVATFTTGTDWSGDEILFQCFTRTDWPQSLDWTTTAEQHNRTAAEQQHQTTYSQAIPTVRHVAELPRTID